MSYRTHTAHSTKFTHSFPGSGSPLLSRKNKDFLWFLSLRFWPFRFSTHSSLYPAAFLFSECSNDWGTIKFWFLTQILKWVVQCFSEVLFSTKSDFRLSFLFHDTGEWNGYFIIDTEVFFTFVIKSFLLLLGTFVFFFLEVFLFYFYFFEIDGSSSRP